MQVHVKLFSRFREHLPDSDRGEATIDLPARATVEQLLLKLGIDQRVKLIAINGQPVTDHAHVLQDNDRVRIFPVVVGG